MNDAVVDIVERELDAAPDRIERADDGLLHETYFVEADGTAAVVQFATDSDDVDSLRRGTNCYRLLRGTPVPVPEVLSDGIETNDDREYVVVERRPGESGKLSISPERTQAAGCALARIHANGGEFDATGRIEFDGGTPTVAPVFDLDHRGWVLAELHDNLDTLRDAEFDAVDGIAALFDRDVEALPTVFEPVLCHDDFSPDNVLYRGDEVTGVIDFDRAYAGHDERDVVKAANAFWMHDPTADWSVRRTFYDGYRATRELSDAFERHEPLYRVETLVAPVAGMVELGEFTDDEVAFYDERLAEAVERVRSV